ncbi:hypothetical protein GCM10025783_18960 [Amnibacterium soli]|uniref:DUF202 domain-containing protein n=1 Tax=Amnibacterium soli TaxID=1282736 RepID=A0ABP8Z5J2_9MICO
MSAPRDPGLQPERTVLAWRRTLLALAVGALVAVRVLPPVLGGRTIVLAVGGLAAVAVLWVVAGRRHRAVEAVFRGRAPASAMPGGALLLALALVATLAAALGLAVTFLPHP